MRLRTYPPGSGTRLMAEVAGNIPGILIFVIGPALAILMSPGAGLSRPTLIVFDSILLLVLVSGVISFVADGRTLFGLRLVPRFERRVRKGAYFNGHEIARRFNELETLALRAEVPALSSFMADGFHDCAQVRASVAALRHGLESDAGATPLIAELDVLDAALAEGQAEALRARLEVVTGTSMNGMLWDALQDMGY